MSTAGVAGTPAGNALRPAGAGRGRADGALKVTGAARYAADHPIAGLLHAVLVTATIPRGRLTRLDATAAEAAPGVVAVLTHRTAPRLRPVPNPPIGQTILPLQGDRIHYDGQPIAVVVAEQLEQAQDAAALVDAGYAREPAIVRFEDALDAAYAPRRAHEPADTRVGDLEAGVREAAVVVEQTYLTAARHHNAMEPSATIAEWRGGELTLHDATQWVWGVRAAVSTAFGLEPERVRVLAPFTSGGFGCKGWAWGHQLLAAMAAQAVGGAVKLVLTRAQGFTAHGYQPPTRQCVTVGARPDGSLTVIRHESINATSTYDEYTELAVSGTRAVYACPAIATRSRVAPVSTITPTPMRAPHEGPGAFALESALDELAHALGVDPVELRLRNYAEHDPTSGLPFSSKELRECYRQGAERFGWHGRPMAPRSLRDGHDLVGWGMATAIMTTFRMEARARVRLHADGRVVVEAGCQEIGTGVYTILPQIAAEVLGYPVERVSLRLGDTRLPETCGTFGSSTTLTVGSAVHDASRRLRERLAEMAAPDPLTLDGYAVGRLLARHGADVVEADGSWAPGRRECSIHSFGAVFVEVRVDAELGLPRVTRCVGAYSAGRIVNPTLARSQMIGGITWGIGQALLEHSDTDRTLGRFVAKNLAGYLVPVNADVPTPDVTFVDEHDPHASAIGARGVGELSAVGVGPAIANAVHHATGVRVRELPIAPERLLVGS